MVDEGGDVEESISSAEQGIYRGFCTIVQYGVGSHWGEYCDSGEGNIQQTTGLDFSLHVNYQSDGIGYAAGSVMNYGSLPVWVDGVFGATCTDGQWYGEVRSKVLFLVVAWQSPSESGSVLDHMVRCPPGTGVSDGVLLVQADN